MPDHEQFLPLFVEHEPRLRVLVASLVRDRHERDDVLQELALVLWREFEKYDPARPFGPWARGVAGNLILRRWRQAGRSPVLCSPEILQAVLDAYDRREARCDERLVALEQCLMKLSHRARTVLSLRYEQDLKLQEIAEVTNGKLQAIHKMLARLRVRLLDCIQAQMATSESTR